MPAIANQISDRIAYADGVYFDPLTLLEIDARSAAGIIAEEHAAGIAIIGIDVSGDDSAPTATGTGTAQRYGDPNNHNPSDANATPDLDDWGPDTYWSAQEWLIWHAAMKAAFGLAEANTRFIYWWSQQTFMAAPLDARSFDSNFRSYAASNGFLQALYGGNQGFPAVQILGGAGDLLNAANNAAAGLPTAGSLSWLIPVGILIFVVGNYVARPAREIKEVFTR